MVCVYCGGFSSAQVCWSCAHLKQQIAEACAEKDKQIAELKTTLGGWIKEAEQRGHDRALLTQRLIEARRIIKQIGSIEIKFYEDANKWLEGKP